MDDYLIGIEEKFLKSWDTMQDFYVERCYQQAVHLQPFLPLIREMRCQGYDEWFYASRSHYLFILTRSQHGDFRRAKTWMGLHIDKNQALSTAAVIAGKTFRIDRQAASITSPLKALLELLMVQPID